MTFPRTASQGPATQPAEYPGINNFAQYSEGIFVGYRYYDRFHQRPLFPFGYGLSYASFSLRHLKLTAQRGGAYRASVTVRNIGGRAGAEVVQAYLHFPTAAGEPPQQLKAFAKVFVAPGGTRIVRLGLPRSSFEYFNRSAEQGSSRREATAYPWAPPRATFRSRRGSGSDERRGAAALAPAVSSVARGTLHSSTRDDSGLSVTVPSPLDGRCGSRAD